jgi:pSer/pThr/pTyr-binding forkhead associated (FHA) protein
MWKLTIEDDEGKQTHLPLAHEEYGVGRAEANSIRLTDRNVSRNHATLKKNGEAWILTDLSSYNGTYINGARVVGDAPVSSGDIIQLGDYRLELLDEILVAAVPGAAPPPAVPPVHQRPNRLVVVVGPQPGTEFPLDKEHFTVGRSEDVTISINHSSVSRVHSEIFALGNGRFEIVDKASANGIRINGVELKRGILEAGDALELGDVRLRFVGAGKIFRADMTQNLPAVAGFDMSRSVGGSGARGGINKLVGAGVAVALAILIGIVAFLAGGKDNPAQGKQKVHVVDEKSKKQVDDALKLLDGKDYDGAHKVLMSIAEDDRPTDDPSFKKVETAWADWRFQAVNDAPDSAKKKAILKEIASTDSVDAKQRTRASEMIRDIDAKEPPPPPDPTQRLPAGAYLPNPGAVPTASATAPTVVQAPVSGPAPELSSEAQMRKQLEPRVWGGRGSVEDIKMLKAICGHMGDHACRARASDLLKKKLESQ